MKAPDKHDLELNEAQWWGAWAELQWVEKDAYVLSSKEMPELFFNRAALLNCWSIDSAKSLVEGKFKEIGRNPVITVYESCSSTVNQLARDGYKKEDVMAVMAAEGEHTQSWARDVKVRLAESPESWARAYLTAFYGELSLLPTVVKIVEKIRQSGSTTLLEAEYQGELAGALAVHRTDLLAGVYCVGTDPKFRRRGVAGELLLHARGMAMKEGRTVFLQTLDSDGAGKFYLKHGFKTLYRKVLMQKKG